jgi:hypothetical protein
MRQLVAATFVALVLAASVGAQGATPSTRVDQRTATVGMRAEIHELVLPGPRLVPRPIDAKAPIVLRVLAVSPHGTDFRYDLEWVGLEPGTFDLTRSLQREDGTAPDGLPPVTVEVRAVLAPGAIEPAPLPQNDAPRLGGYETWQYVAGIAWVVGLLAILFVGRGRRRSESTIEARPVTLADRLRPIVVAAANGSLDEGGKAELERLLLAFWRRRLGLQDVKAGEAVQRLRADPEAGALLRQLELWLHRPTPATDVDVTKLLAPYRDVAADALDVGGAR